MPKFIDNFINKTTMYRLVLYVLTSFIVAALVLSLFGLLPFSPLGLLYSTVILVAVSWITNELFVRVFKTHANVESFYITAFILALIITPPHAGEYLSILPFLIWAAIWSIASKFILAVNKKHVFNPAAFAVALTAITLNSSATWWIGTLYMLPFVIVGGLLVIKKIRRFDLVIFFGIAALISIFATTKLQLGAGLLEGTMAVVKVLERIFVDTPILFFAFIMLTEPLTTPPTRFRRIIYGILVGALFAPAIHLWSFYSTPELALLVGNVLALSLSPMRKYLLTLKRSDMIAKETGEFVFIPDHPVRFKPGQYIEWTLGHEKSDSRGNRRYFTIASSPTEPEIKLGVKFYQNASSFKTAFAKLEEGDTIMAHGVAGDFTLPHNKRTKLAMIAGGIGITPFRSMIKYLLDKNEKRDIKLIYSNNSMADIAYSEIWQAAEAKLGIKTICTLTDTQNMPPSWTGRMGFVSPQMVRTEIPDFHERTFYISGPRGMVIACKEMLLRMGISRRKIKTDFFPGLA